MDKPRQPIGLFDSGVGGLTVLRQLQDALPAENLLYLGDTARVPYGTKSERTVIRYAEACADVLLQHGIKILVVACNTASAFALPALQKKLGIPVLGVVEPGARAAAAATRNGHIGVIATGGTINSRAYQNAITRLKPEATVYAQACPLLVALAEEGWTEGEVPEKIVAHYLAPLLNEKMDTLVLGCTHYPLLKPVIRKLCGDSIRLIDSAEETGKETRRVLESTGLLNGGTAPGAHRYLVSDAPQRFTEVGKFFLGESPQNVEWVDF